MHNLKASKPSHDRREELRDSAGFPVSLLRLRHLGARDAGCSSRLIGSTFYSICYGNACALGSEEWRKGEVDKLFFNMDLPSGEGRSALSPSVQGKL